MTTLVGHSQSPESSGRDEVTVTLDEVKTLVKRTGEDHGVVALSDVYRNFVAVVLGHRLTGELLSLTQDGLVYIDRTLVAEYDTPQETKNAVEDDEVACDVIAGSVWKIIQKAEQIKARRGK